MKRGIRLCGGGVVIERGQVYEDKLSGRRYIVEGVGKDDKNRTRVIVTAYLQPDVWRVYAFNPFHERFRLVKE